MTDTTHRPPVRLLDLMESEFADLHQRIGQVENNYHLSGFFLDGDLQNRELRLLKSQVEAVQDQIRHLKAE
jgi:hypothetical protein